MLRNKHALRRCIRAIRTRDAPRGSYPSAGLRIQKKSMTRFDFLNGIGGAGVWLEHRLNSPASEAMRCFER